MTSNDPFAAASMNGAQSAAAGVIPTPDDPFNGVDVDMSDPFATEDTVNAGGNFRPAPFPDALNGRLVVYIPRSFRKDAEGFRDEKDKLRERWSADLYVIDRAPLTYTVRRTDPKTNVETEEEITLSPAELPAEFPGTFVYQLALIGQLRRVSGTAKPILMGVMRRGPKADARRAGKTFEDIAREFEAWRQGIAAGRSMKEVAFSWQVDVNVTPAQKAEVMAWWNSVKTTIKPLGPAVDLTGTPMGNRS